MWSIDLNCMTTRQVVWSLKSILVCVAVLSLHTQLTCGSAADTKATTTASPSQNSSSKTTEASTDLGRSGGGAAPQTFSKEQEGVFLQSNQQDQLSVDRVSVVETYSAPKSSRTGLQVPMIPVSVPKICSHPPLLANDCMYEERWYFSTDFRSCLQFQGGSECDANGNNFPTAAVCRQICRTDAFVDLDMRSMPEWRCGVPRVDQHLCRPGRWPDTRFYYDDTLNRCAALEVRGCAASNTFVSLDDCTFYCRQPDVVLEKVPPVACQLPVVRGFEICYNGQPRWFFNAQTRQCQWFMYSGCYGNWNNFLSYGDCQAVCGGDEYGPDACALPPDPGTSFQYRARYFYDTASRTCLEMRYSGFGGNANNFFVPEECESECMQ